MMMKRKKSSVTINTQSFMRTARVLADFRKGIREFLSFSESMLGTMGITSQQYQALLVLVLAREDGVMVKDLATELLLLPHGAVQLINRLAAAGLAERRMDPGDARVSRVHPTTKGIHIMNILVQAHARELRQHERLLANSLRSLRRLTDAEAPL